MRVTGEIFTRKGGGAWRGHGVLKIAGSPEVHFMSLANFSRVRFLARLVQA